MTSTVNMNMYAVAPSTPVCVRRKLSIEDMDRERRMKRESLRRSSFAPLLDNTSSVLNQRKRSSSLVPSLCDEEEDSHLFKRQCSINDHQTRLSLNQQEQKENTPLDLCDHNSMLALSPVSRWSSGMPAQVSPESSPVRIALRPRNLSWDLSSTEDSALPYLPL
eukprot:Nitzschia sp. Nitz4//scaffold346_size17405//4255//4746//NITZ4_008828-RA/size17405-processed-gene-0.4-mRNA-1//-1//CDS//3329548644//1563//frame0